LIAVMGLSSARATWAQSPQVQWDGIARVVAFADVHGAYDELLALLRETGIVDAKGRWAAGSVHVDVPTDRMIRETVPAAKAIKLNEVLRSIYWCSRMERAGGACGSPCTTSKSNSRSVSTH
jgi:hypothetical protein